MRFFPYAIFDMDGTLVDSMKYWREAPLRFARSIISTFSDADIDRLCHVHSYGEAVQLFRAHGVDMTEDSLMRASENMMMKHYRDDIDVKAGTVALLDEMKAAGVKMGIVTMTPHYDVDICLQKTGLDKYFSFVLTPEDTSDGSGKEKPEIFGTALEKLGCENPKDCMFFEDSLYAVKTAKKLGFYIVGVYDERAEVDEVQMLSDVFLNLD